MEIKFLVEGRVKKPILKDLYLTMYGRFITLFFVLENDDVK